MSNKDESNGSADMKTLTMRWIINPGIVFCFGFFASAIFVGLLETIFLNFTNIRLDLFDQLATPSAYVLGYFCAVIALNIDAFQRTDAEDRFIK